MVVLIYSALKAVTGNLKEDAERWQQKRQPQKKLPKGVLS